MRYVVLLIVFIGLLASSKFALDVYNDSRQRSEFQEDYAEINRVNYGLFNIQLWKDKALDIFQNRIGDFKISPEAFDVLNKQVEKYLYQSYDKFFSKEKITALIMDNLKDSGLNKMIMGFIQKNIGPVIERFDLKSQIPSLTKQISKEIKNSEPEIRALMQKELLTMILDDADTELRDRREGIYQKYGMTQPKETTEHLAQRVVETDAKIKRSIQYTLGTIGACILLLLLIGGVVPFREKILSMTLLSMVLLLLGITLPMIDIDARLNSFKIGLMGENIEFGEQILYYQSKSITQVTQTLFEGHGWDLKLVGVLIFCFSIVFPLLKLILSTLYLYWNKVRMSKVAQTIIFYLGKWSMADVFVVAIFMAYIGFYGIVTAQLGSIGQNQSGYAVETMNYSRLAPGALFFTLYCLVSIIISLFINRQDQKHLENNPSTIPSPE